MTAVNLMKFIRSALGSLVRSSFNDLATKKANPSDKASDGCGVDDRLHELVVRHGEVYLGFKIRPQAVLYLQLLAPGKTLLVLRHCDFLLLGLLLRQQY